MVVCNVMSRNLIYTCCFHQDGYVDVVKHFIQSAKQYIDDNTDILVYTTSQYKELLCDTGVKFFEKNFYKTMNQARISKVDIFDYPEINQYGKILYLDADSLVLAPIAPVFDAITDDVVYAVGEGSILCDAEYWGRSLFLRENSETVDREGLGAYALGFKNIPELKKLFIKIKQAFYLDMYQNKLRFYDQPFINYYLIQNNVSNTETFKKYIQSRPTAENATRNNIVVAHFSGCPGHANVKLELINEFKSQMTPPATKPKITPPTTKPINPNIMDALNKIKALVASIESML